MQPYDLISKEWIVSPTARLVYRTAAVVSLLIFIPVIAALLNEPVRHFRPLLFVGVLGMAINQVGMEYFLFRFDNSHPLKQVFWFCAMIFAPIGAALFCFVVYSRSEALKTACARNPDQVSRQI